MYSLQNLSSASWTLGPVHLPGQVISPIPGSVRGREPAKQANSCLPLMNNVKTCFKTARKFSQTELGSDVEARKVIATVGFSSRICEIVRSSSLKRCLGHTGASDLCCSQFFLIDGAPFLS